MTPGNRFQKTLEHHHTAYQDILAEPRTVLSFFLDQDGIARSVKSTNLSAHRQLALEALNSEDTTLAQAWSALSNDVPFLCAPYGLSIILETNTPPAYSIFHETKHLATLTETNPIAWTIDALSCLQHPSLEARIGSIVLHAHDPEEALLAHYILNHPNKLARAHETPKFVSIQTSPDRLKTLRKTICQTPKTGNLFP